ncbi:MAG TPA: DUF1385 domain-containing protein [Acidimicrobiales bacterium]|nr:DUF1385 domain-containing protein [Acidimicrobiales bacterium]
MSSTVRIGGQALADGVLMRTSRAWAVARDDGSVQVGTLPVRRTSNVPVLRFLVGLVGGMRLAVGRGMLGRGAGAAVSAGARRRNGRFLWALLAVEVVGLAFAFLVDGRSLPAWAGVAATAGPWVLAFAVLRLASPASLWRYHGAEHKAVAAHEVGVSMDDVGAVLACPRVHDRCGTNLVFLAMVGGLALTGVPAAFQVPAFLALMATTAEAVTQAAGRPRSPVSRVVLAGGRGLQRFVTTAEPSAAEQAVGCRALAACLAEHHRVSGTLPEPATEVAAAA